MFGAWHEWLVWFGCMVLVGAAVKLTDDYLDTDFDMYTGRRTLAGRFGRATLPYALALAIAATALDRQLAVSLFFGSYAVGMFSTWREWLPTRVPAYVEIALALLVSALLCGWQLALWGVATMAVVDWLDDVIDLSGDRRSGQGNIVNSIGFVETLMFILAALCTAVLTEAKLTAVALLALVLLGAGAEATTVHLWKTHDNDGGLSL